MQEEKVYKKKPVSTFNSKTIKQEEEITNEMLLVFLFVCVKFEVTKKKLKNLDTLVILVTLLPTLEVWIAFFFLPHNK